MRFPGVGMFAAVTNCTMGLVVEIRHALTGLALGVSTFAFAAPAHATWRVAETEHFKIFSEATAEELSATVTRLEKFDKIVRAMTANSRPSSPVKVTMYQVRDMLAVAQTMPYPTEGIGGYYTTSFKGPYLVTMRKDLKEDAQTRSRIGRSLKWGPEVTQHEYLHHYMYQYFNATTRPGIPKASPSITGRWRSAKTTRWRSATRRTSGWT